MYIFIGIEKEKEKDDMEHVFAFDAVFSPRKQLLYYCGAFSNDMKYVLYASV